MTLTIVFGAGAVWVSIIFWGWLARRAFVVVKVEQESMFPTLQAGDRVLAIRHLPVHWLRKGQVVLVSVGSEEVFFVKRVVALSGETFWASVVEQDSSGQLITVERAWHIPPGYFFVCGDNASRSTDSRVWGPLPYNSLRGIVFLHLPQGIGT